MPVTVAANCTRGHVLTSDVSGENVAAKCSRCGARILTACEACGQRMKGFVYYDDVTVIGGTGYTKPSFCDQCGAAHPWFGREEMVWEIENRLTDDAVGLSPAQRLQLREELHALAAAGLDEQEQIRRWGVVAQLALDAGVPLRDVQLAARHADPEQPRSTTVAARTSTATPPT